MMEKDYSSNFGTIDYCMFAGVLFISGAIGLIVSFKGSKSPEEFFMGNRSFKPFPVSFSMLTSYISAIGFLGFSGEAYANGMQLFIITFGIMLGIAFSSYFIIPMLFPLKIISVNEYIELRFRSKELSLCISLFIVTKYIFLSSINLFATTIALAGVTNLSILTNIFLLGGICALYSSLGGIRAVIWTDVFQLSLMMIGVVFIMAIGFHQNGGIIETFYTASIGRRLEMFNMNPSPYVRHTFWNTLAFGFFYYTQFYSADQVNLQRICSVKTLKNARRIMSYCFFGIFFIYVSLFLCGIIAYVSYAGCDPMALGILKRKEEIVPYFVMNKLGYFSGLPGIFVAAIIAGSLSTLSSLNNASVAQIWRDICLKFNYFKTASVSQATLISKIISLVVGSVVIVLAILLSNAEGVIEITVIAVGTISGPIFGVYLIGFFLPKCNLKGVLSGFISSSVLTTWIAFGSWYYKTPVKMLPFSTDECYSNFTSTNISRIDEFDPIANNSFKNFDLDKSFFGYFYRISYLLYSVIGPVVCILFAVIISYLTGNQDINEISPNFISPSVRKFYWTKEQLDAMQEREADSDVEINNFERNREELENYYECLPIEK